MNGELLAAIVLGALYGVLGFIVLLAAWFYWDYWRNGQ